MKNSNLGAAWLCLALFLSIWFLSACAAPVHESVKSQGLELNLEVVSPVTVTLTWNAVEGSQDYLLERKPEGADFTLLATVVGQTSYTDTTVEEGKDYTYRVSALTAGTPVESAEASTDEPTPPAEPSPQEPTPPTPGVQEAAALSLVPWSYARDSSGEPRKDTNSGGGPLSVAGQSYTQGLGTRLENGTNSEVMYSLVSNCTVFRTKVGVDDVSNGTAVFQIFADGNKLWDSGLVATGELKETDDLNVEGKNYLLLVVQPSSSLHTVPAPVEPTPTEPDPGQPAPTEPAPTEPEPTPVPEPTPTPQPNPNTPVYVNWLEPTLTCTTQPAAAAEKAIKGEWGAVFDWQGLVATHLANLPDGRVLSWSSWDKTKQGGTPTDYKENTTGYLWNPTDNSFIEMNNPEHDMFCAGLAVLPNGDVFAGGGGNETNLYKTSVFEVGNNAYQWRPGPRMIRDHWYGTAVALPDGGVLMTMGSDRSWNSTEILTDGTSTTGQWTLLEGADTGPAMPTIGTPTSDIPQPNNPRSSEYEVRGWYPYLSVAPNGKLFDAGPVPRLYEMDVSGTGSVRQVGTRNDQLRTWGTYVMYDEGKILVTGGAVIRGEGATNSAVSISLAETGLEVKNAAAMEFQRAFQSGVMLPTGDVLMVGGNATGKQFTSEAAVLEAEVWNPTTNTWRTLAAEARPRTYHSAAILLPDGRVLATGGGLCGRNGCLPGIDEPNGEIFSPPYLFNPDGTAATRPVITGAPERVGYNQNFVVSVEGRNINKFSLIKLSSITHGINTDLRYLSVPFVKGEGANYTLTSDENPNVLTPGYYFLFALDDRGVPSVSKTILVAR